MEKKDAEAMEARLAEMGKKIDELKNRLGTVTGEVKAELERRIDAALAGQEAQRQRLHQLKDRGLEHWDTLKDQAGKAWSGLEKSLQDLASSLKKYPRGRSPGSGRSGMGPKSPPDIAGLGRRGLMPSRAWALA